MDFPVSAITRPVIGKLVALQNFFFNRPRIDIDLLNNPEGLYGKRSLGFSRHQKHPEPIPIPYAIYDFQFYWNFILRIKNNSSKTAYNIKIEKIYKTSTDYIEKIDDIASLKEGQIIELEYILRHNASKSGEECIKFLNNFPGHIEKLEIIVSYTNESRKKFYTRFIATKELKTNEHLLRKPK